MHSLMHIFCPLIFFIKIPLKLKHFSTSLSTYPGCLIAVVSTDIANAVGTMTMTTMITTMMMTMKATMKIMTTPMMSYFFTPPEVFFLSDAIIHAHIFPLIFFFNIHFLGLQIDLDFSLFKKFTISCIGSLSKNSSENIIYIF